MPVAARLSIVCHGTAAWKGKWHRRLIAFAMIKHQDIIVRCDLQWARPKQDDEVLSSNQAAGWQQQIHAGCYQGGENHIRMLRIDLE